MNGYLSYQTTCRKCNGSGSVIEDPCQSCFGKGTLAKNEQLDIDIPPGVADGMEMRIPNKGQSGSKGGGPGNLFINFRVEQSPDFERDGADVYSVAKISMAQAVLGGTIPVKGIMGDMNLKVRQGTVHGKRSRLRGRGMPRVQSKARGDHFVEFRIQLPDQLPIEQQRLILEFARNESGRLGDVDGLDEHVSKLAIAKKHADETATNSDGDETSNSKEGSGIFSAFSGMFDSSEQPTRGGVDDGAKAKGVAEDDDDELKPKSATK